MRNSFYLLLTRGQAQLTLMEAAKKGVEGDATLPPEMAATVMLDRAATLLSHAEGNIELATAKSFLASVHSANGQDHEAIIPLSEALMYISAARIAQPAEQKHQSAMDVINDKLDRALDRLKNKLPNAPTTLNDAALGNYNTVLEKINSLPKEHREISFSQQSALLNNLKGGCYVKKENYTAAVDSYSAALRHYESMYPLMINTFQKARFLPSRAAHPIYDTHNEIATKLEKTVTAARAHLSPDELKSLGEQVSTVFSERTTRLNQMHGTMNNIAASAALADLIRSSMINTVKYLHLPTTAVASFSSRQKASSSHMQIG